MNFLMTFCYIKISWTLDKGLFEIICDIIAILQDCSLRKGGKDFEHGIWLGPDLNLL